VSYAMKVAKASARGDPGLFGFLGKAIGSVAKFAGSVLPGPVGTIAKLVGNTLVPAKPISVASVGSMPGIGPVLRGGGINLPMIPGRSIPVGAAAPYPGLVPPSIFPQQQPGGPDFSSPRPGVGCDQAGYHRNRTGYFTKRYGWVEKGSVCVKNRKRNPLNPRALSRSLARLTSAKKAVRCLADFTVRPKKACGCR